MRVLSISADRSKRGILHAGSPAFKRQESYARALGSLDIIAFSLKSDGVHAVDAGALCVYPTNAPSKWLQAFYALRIARTLSQPDVVSAQDPFETGFVAWLIAILLQSPLHIQVHTDFLSPEYARLSLLNRTRAVIAGFVLKRATRVRVVSRRIKAGIEKRYTLRVPVTALPIFTDLQRIRAGARDIALEKRFAPYGTKILVVSRLEKEKNVALAIRAYAAVAPESSCLIIIGEGREREALARLSYSLSAHRIFFEGDRDVAPYYALADLVLCPSKYEGYGLVIVEALAAGKPVISTDVGIAREAGAIVVREEKFVEALKEWFVGGPRVGELRDYAYKNFDEYVRAYREDIAACASKE